MTVTDAIDIVLQAGGEFMIPAPGRLRASIPTTHPPDVDAALATIRAHRDEALALITLTKGRAVCLYSDLAGERLWIVADEEDAQVLLSQGERRGQIYTGNEVRLIVRIGDREIVRQVHAFKSEFNTKMRPEG